MFRVDNPHTKALPFWEWCIAEIQKKTPEAIFLAEAFTRPHVMYSLAKGGYTQGYTYFTWRTDGPGLQAYFEEICNVPVRDFYRPNVWPNTPDILHEQLQVSDPAARRSVFMQRVILAGTLSANYGIYGPAYELCEWRPAKPQPERRIGGIPGQRKVSATLLGPNRSSFHRPAPDTTQRDSPCACMLAAQ